MNPGGLDYEGFLFRQGVRAVGHVVSGTANTRLRPAQGHVIERLRMAISDALRHRLGNRPETGIITALAVGDQQAIGPVQWDVFNRTGRNAEHGGGRRRPVPDRGGGGKSGALPG